MDSYVDGIWEEYTGYSSGLPDNRGGGASDDLSFVARFAGERGVSDFKAGFSSPYGAAVSVLLTDTLGRPTTRRPSSSPSVEVASSTPSG